MLLPGGGGGEGRQPNNKGKPILYRGSLHTSQISHLLPYPSLWLLVPGLTSQFSPLFLIQHAFNVGNVCRGGGANQF